MRILILSPAPARSRLGNAVTARRYAAIFRRLGHTPAIAAWCEGPRFDLLVALHAKKSARAVLAARRADPDLPIVVVLTGTDIYRDVERSVRAQAALRAADAIVGLQPLAVRRLPRAVRAKFVSIVQSVDERPEHRGRTSTGVFTIAVVGHLRAEKDPLRIAAALRLLPDAGVHVAVAGGILDDRYRERLDAAIRRDPRIRYCGELSQGAARALIARSDMLAVTSRMEGGANVVCEAIACGTPVVASAIDGNIGLLGDAYRGFFPTGDTRALAALIDRCITDTPFLAQLRRSVAARRALVDPRREARAWKQLIRSLT